MVRGASDAGPGRNGKETYLELLINGAYVNCLLDTGSEVTLIPHQLAAGIQLTPTSQKLLAANNTLINVEGEISLTVGEVPHQFDIRGYVSSHVIDVILGVDFLDQQRGLWNFARGEIMLNGRVYKLIRRDPMRWHRRVVVTDSTTIPARSECVIPATIVYRNFARPRVSEPCGWITENAEPAEGLRVSRVLLPQRSVDVPVRILNVTTNPVRLEAGSVIADLRPVSFIDGQETGRKTISQEQRAVVEEMVGRVDRTVPRHFTAELEQLLADCADAFSLNENDLGRTSILTHRIATNGARPVRQPLRRHPPAHLDAIHEHVSNM